MAIAIYCKPVSHLLEQPNDNMWQTVFFFFLKKRLFLIRLKTYRSSVDLEN